MLARNTDVFFFIMLSHVLCFFGQLRTQALASLHSGLQNNQGLPVGLIAKWLAMEVSFFLHLMRVTFFCLFFAHDDPICLTFVLG